MAHEAEPPAVDAGDAPLGLPDVNLLTAAALLASDDSALGAAVRRIVAGLGDSAPVLAAFGNFADHGPDPS